MGLERDFGRIMILPADTGIIIHKFYFFLIYISSHTNFNYSIYIYIIPKFS